MLRAAFAPGFSSGRDGVVDGAVDWAMTALEAAARRRADEAARSHRGNEYMVSM